MPPKIGRQRMFRRRLRRRSDELAHELLSPAMTAKRPDGTSCSSPWGLLLDESAPIALVSSDDRERCAQAKWEGFCNVDGNERATHDRPGFDLSHPEDPSCPACVRVRLVHRLHQNGSRAPRRVGLASDHPEDLPHRGLRGLGRDLSRMDVEPTDRDPSAAGSLARGRRGQLPNLDPRLLPALSSRRADGVHHARQTASDPSGRKKSFEGRARARAPSHVAEPRECPRAGLSGERSKDFQVNKPKNCR